MGGPDIIILVAGIDLIIAGGRDLWTLIDVIGLPLPLPLPLPID